MTSMRKGSQKPRIDQYKNGDIWLAEKTIELLASYGMDLMPWQKNVLRRWMALDEDGKWANPEAGLSVARQNGKSELIIARIIGGMIYQNESLVYTAQSEKTVTEIRRRVQQFFYKAEPEIRDLLRPEFDKEPRNLDYIELQDGGRCVFATRTRTGGLGFTSDTLLLDEAAELNDAQQEALLPTISAGKTQNHQIILASMPPTTGSSGTVFIRTRTKVLDGKAPEWCWQEWSVESITDPSDEEAWYATNPSLGYYLMKSAIKKEAVSMAIDSFNSQRLGYFPSTESKRAISDDEWNALIVEKVQLPQDPELVYAVKFSPDRSSVSLAVGVLMPDSKVHVEIIERKPLSAGTSWLVKWLLERWKNANRLIIDGQAGSQLLIEELVRTDRRISKRILTPSVKDAIAAYAAFDEAIKQKTLSHNDQPGLNLGIRVVKHRSIGQFGGFGFASMNNEISSDAVEAVAFACYGAVRFQGARSKSSGGPRFLM